METLNVKDNRDFVDFLCMSDFDTVLAPIWATWGEDGTQEPGIYDVECTVNGVVVPIIELFKEVYHRMGKHIKKHAGALLMDKCDDFETALDALGDVARKMRQHLMLEVEKRLDMEFDEDDWRYF